MKMKPFLILALASLASSLSIPSTNQKVLDGSYLNVEFYPVVRSLKNEQELNFTYTEEDLTTLLDLTSTRFHKLTIVAGYKTLPVGYNSTLKLVAKWNKAHVKPIRISIYDLAIPDDPEDILNLISEANAIYPGTVDQVILNFSVKKIDFQTTPEFVKSFGKKLHKLNVKLSIQFNYYECDLFDEVKWEGASGTEFIPQQLPNSITLPNTTRLILNNADFAIFQMPIIYAPNYISREPKETFDYQNKQFVLCEDAVSRALDKPIKVHMRFMWFSQGREFYKTPSYLSTMWELLGDKAAKEKKDVFVVGAFDTPFMEAVEDSADEKPGSNGWWEMKNGNDKKIRMDGFVEKSSLG